MAVLSPPRRQPPSPGRRSTPKWLSRSTVLAADAVFGALVLILAFAGRLIVPQAASGPSATSPAQAQPVEIVARSAGLMPPGQSTGMAVAADGSLAIVDRGRQVITHLDATGKPLAEWGPNFGPGLDARDMIGIAADGDGWAVLDRGALRILRLDAQGQARADRTIDLSKLETYGPNGLAGDGHGALVMADTGRDRIVAFNANGVMTTAVGAAGQDLGKFKQPMFLAFAPDGSLFVSDWETSRVEHFGADFQAINAWPLPVHAWGITVDSLERVFTPDGDHHLVRMFGPDGSLLAQVGAEPGTGIPLDGISQVAASPDASRLWVLGNDGLARVDLTPYAGIRPSGASSAVKTPLAVLGVLMLLVAAIGARFPRLALLLPGGPGRTRRQTSPARISAVPPPGSPSSTAADGSAGPTQRARSTVAADGSAGPTRHARSTVAADGSAGAVQHARSTVAASATERAVPSAAAVVGGVLCAIGGLAAIAAELAIADASARLDPWPRLAFLAIASLIFAAGCLVSGVAIRWRLLLQTWPGPALREARLRLRFSFEWKVLTVVGPILILATAAGVMWSQNCFQTPEATRGALLWLAALVIAVSGLVASGTFKRPSVWTLVPWVLFAIALVPRVWHNADLPYGIWFDEAEGGLQARRLAQTGLYTPITDTYGRDASLFYYLMADAQALIADPVLADRVVACVVGALCAPLMYFLGRELLGWRVGVAAGLVLATSRWHLDVSRLGWDPISLPLCAILAFWLLARAVRSGKFSDAVWAGLAIGLGMHAYIGFRALPIVALILLLYGGLLRGWSPLLFAARVGTVLVSAALAALPIIIFAIQDPVGFNGRLTQTLVFNEQVPLTQKLDEIWTNLQKHVLMFHISGDMNGRHNLPGAPMLDPLSGLLMVVGLAVLAVRPLDWRSWLVFGWGLVSLAGGVFTFPFEAPQAMRSLGITPVLALVVGLALVLAFDRGVAYLRTRQRAATALVSVLGGAVLVWIGFTNLTFFFGRQMNDPTVWESFSTRETLPSRAALAAATPYEAILGSPTIAPTLQQQLMVPNIQSSIRAFDPSTDLPYRGDGSALIVLESEHDAGLAEEVARYYPDAQRIPIIPPRGLKSTADELILDSAVIVAHRGFDHARQADGTWRVDVGVDVPGDYTFQVASGFTLSVDAAPVQSGEPVVLARGNHLLVLDGGSGVPTLAWQTPESTGFQPIADRLLFVAPPGGNGLLATFYPTLDFRGAPTESIVDPVLAHYYHVSPFARLGVSPRTWSVEWRGTLDVPTTGVYRFEAERLSRAGVWIDEQLVFDDTTDGPSATSAGSVPLTPGRHPIRVRMQNRGDGGPHLYLYWTPPGGGRELIPGRVLFPPSPRPNQ